MKRGSIFELDGVPRLREACPLALQHVVAMIVGCVTPAIIVAGAAAGGLNSKDRVILIQASLLMSGLATLIQLFPIGKRGKFAIGSGLPMIMGVSFAYVPSMQAIAEGYGIATIFGAQIVGGIVALIMGLLVKKIRVFFPPLITGTVVFTIGLSLYPTAINYMAGGSRERKLWSMAELAGCVFYSCSSDCSEPFWKRNLETGFYSYWNYCRLHCVDSVWNGESFQRRGGRHVPGPGIYAFWDRI